MKMTLLELVQKVLRSIKGETVNDIEETQESLDVVSIVQECYLTLLAEVDYPETKSLYQLTATSSSTPTLMQIPEDALTMEYLEYNYITADDTEDNFVKVQYLPLDQFLNVINSFDTSEDTVESYSISLNGDTFNIKCMNDRAPVLYTTLDDTQILFDNYDSEIEAFLQKSKTRAYGIRPTTWETTNNYIPLLDAHQFPILLKMSKAMAWRELKTVENVAEERGVRRLRIKAEAKKYRANQRLDGAYSNNYPNYGRRV